MLQKLSLPLPPALTVVAEAAASLEEKEEMTQARNTLLNRVRQNSQVKELLAETERYWESGVRIKKKVEKVENGGDKVEGGGTGMATEVAATPIVDDFFLGGQIVQVAPSSDPLPLPPLSYLAEVHPTKRKRGYGGYGDDDEEGVAKRTRSNDGPIQERVDWGGTEKWGAKKERRTNERVGRGRGRGDFGRGRGDFARGRGDFGRGSGDFGRGRGDFGRGRGDFGRGRGGGGGDRGGRGGGRGSDRGSSYASANAGSSNLHPSWAARKDKSAIVPFKGKKMTFGEDGTADSTSSPFNREEKPTYRSKASSELHPSWSARKEKSAIVPFKGKKISFDDDD